MGNLQKRDVTLSDVQAHANNHHGGEVWNLVQSCMRPDPGPIRRAVARTMAGEIPPEVAEHVAENRR